MLVVEGGAEPFPGWPRSPPRGRRVAELPLGPGWGGRTGCHGAAARGRGSAGVTLRQEQASPVPARLIACPDEPGRAAPL